MRTDSQKGMTTLTVALRNSANAPTEGYECGVDKLSEEGGGRSPQKKKSSFLGVFRREIPSLLLLFFRVSHASSSPDSQCHLPPYLNLTFAAAYLYYRTKPWQVKVV
jgi:hypothetical protein